MAEPEQNSGEMSPLVVYKNLLQKIIDTRPSGTRQRLAEAMGKNRSFVSLITNPSYLTPIPAQHLETIFHICHFAPQERQAFLDVYKDAHPGRTSIARSTKITRQMTIELPDFGDAALNRKAEEMIHTFVRCVTELVEIQSKSDRQTRSKSV